MVIIFHGGVCILIESAQLSNEDIYQLQSTNFRGRVGELFTRYQKFSPLQFTHHHDQNQTILLSYKTQINALMQFSIK